MGVPLPPALDDMCMNWLLDKVASKTTDLSRSFVSWMIFSHLLINPMLWKAHFNYSTQSTKNFNSKKSQSTKIKLPSWMSITKTDKGIKTKIYRKPTFTGSYMKWQSYVPLRYKQNLVFILLNHNYKICNSYTCIKNFSEFHPTSNEWFSQ